MPVELSQSGLVYNDRELCQVSQLQDKKDSLAMPSDQI